MTRIPDPANMPSRIATGGRYPWLIAAYLTFGAALCLSLTVAGWGAYVDFDDARISVLQAHLNRLRSHALRTVMRIQDELQNQSHRGDVAALADVPWLRTLWDRFIPQDESHLYAAVIGPDRTIYLHNHREFEGKKLDPNWLRQPASDADDDFYLTNEPKLTGGPEAIDIAVPIIFDGKEIATYHSGFNTSWFASQLSEKSRDARNRWTIAFAVIVAVIVLAGLSLFQIARRLSQLQTAVVVGRVQRMADLGQLAAGIAHEIRNPLNVIRLNLHVIKKLTSQPNAEQRVTLITDETVREIERVDGLLRSLLEYARPDQPNREIVDLTCELRSVSVFLRPLVEGRNLRLKGDLPEHPVVCEIDRGRFRQLTLNLLKNATEAVGRNGNIEFELRVAGEMAELIVRDDGPGVPPDEVNRIFDAFYTTKELGTGLGLALVRRYAEEAGGTIRYEPRIPHGAAFIASIPLVAVPPILEQSQSYGAASLS